jgi:hypothetical protein
MSDICLFDEKQILNYVEYQQKEDTGQLRLDLRLLPAVLHCSKLDRSLLTKLQSNTK